MLLYSATTIGSCPVRTDRRRRAPRARPIGCRRHRSGTQSLRILVLVHASQPLHKQTPPDIVVRNKSTKFQPFFASSPSRSSAGVIKVTC
eukprot:scaffold76988_cov31-Prasinocladus_malaysianus.AAC.1